MTKEQSAKRHNERLLPKEMHKFANWYKKNQLFCAGTSSSGAVFNFKTCEIIEDISSSFRLQLQNG